VALEVTKVTNVTDASEVSDISETLEQVRLQFSISDTGPGIAHDELEMLFEAFRQTQAGREAQEGTGLGLTISREFIKMMGGEMTVRSEIGRGTTFAFDLLVREVDAMDILPPLLNRRVIALEPGQPRFRILVVDDKPANRHLLVRLLRPLGFDVREAGNGKEALEVWNTFGPHVILLDMRMPIMDGFETTRYIKAATEGQATIIIALTANGFDNEQAAALSAGCDDVVSKPFREEEIFMTMHKHLGVRYVYEESEPSKVENQQSNTDDVLTPEAFLMLPDTLYIELQGAVSTADLKTMQRLIDQIRKQNAPLADALLRLVKEFRFDILQSMFKENRG
jgi:CheY-like chemotaxis protein